MDHKAAFVNKRTFTSARCEQDGNCYVVGQIFARAADAIGMDPTLVALKNDGAEGHDLAWLNAYKEEHNLPVVDSLKACIEAGKKAINWDSKWHEPGTKKLPNGRMHGLGFIWSHQWQNGAPSSVAGRQKPYLIINRNKVILSALHPDVGVNHRTGLCYIIAEAIGLKLDDVFYPHILEARWSEYETSLVAGMGSIGFSTNCWPVYAAARNLRNKILELAANQLSATPDELEIKDSVVFVKADPTKEIGVFSIRNISSTSATNDNVEAVVPSSSDIPTIEGGGIYVSRQAHFCEVEVDTDTGEVFVTKVVNCNDIGQAIVPESVNCQQDGGTVVGISKGRSEEVVYCPATGVALNTDMIGYKISTILDCGPIEPIMLQNRMGYAPYGSTGCGESNATIPCALTAIAVHNAIGKWVDSYPTSPSVVLKALGKA
jgi:xanthine dehydrogenase molybdenum-binding subunit